MQASERRMPTEASPQPTMDEALNHTATLSGGAGSLKACATPDCWMKACAMGSAG
jgi:hypothetical protein